LVLSGKSFRGGFLGGRDLELVVHLGRCLARICSNLAICSALGAWPRGPSGPPEGIWAKADRVTALMLTAAMPARIRFFIVNMACSFQGMVL
jgi:hypothetical protein